MRLGKFCTGRFWDRMNLILVDFGDVEEGGVFKASERASEHLQHVIKAQDGDFLRAGVTNGQKGVCQVIRQDVPGRRKPNFKFQLLPLTFSSIDLIQRHSPSLTESSSVSSSPTPKRQKIDYKFGALSAKELANWKIHPYLKDPSDVTASETEAGVVYLRQPVIDVCMCIPRPRTFDKSLQVNLKEATLTCPHSILAPCRSENCSFSLAVVLISRIFRAPK
eukprot:Gregarina_sp_Poly_1__10223@NODE_709_length_6670_cov_39_483265_g536_i0_p4_GENE_NODE_709_length_6670_cov_39_483265_g536_i0NODE_709_length_6670_cov_39_483265_g536_i0_p4_ORF_typecomplete_len221_score24_21Methyltrans_RNA/PF04452_14/0_68Methyltrans_RNA/PF04452_14/6_6e02_NODE_709_length_6670_cov_39_483265_g536_i046915353